MSVALLAVSIICFVWCIFYIFFSVNSALTAGRRRNQSMVFLEFQPWRARDEKEATRVRLLRQIGFGALCAFPASVMALVASVVAS
jgi:hypothetical protein